MPKALVVYYSLTGNTKKMAVRLAAGLTKAGLETDLKKAEETDPAELLGYDLILVGSPVYYGTMSWPVKKLLDESVKYHGKLRGKIGGAFASSGNPSGGKETTVLDILKSLLIHGMIVQGDAKGDHYGPAAVRAPTPHDLKTLDSYAARMADLTRRLFS